MSVTTTTTQRSGQDRTSRCKLIRRRLFGDGTHDRWQMLLGKAGIDFEAPWVQRHIATCPRCQRRFANIGRVQVALSLLRSRPMGLGLLGRANAKAVGVLRHDVRDAPKAKALKAATPQPTLFEQARQWRGAIGQMAACMTILALGRLGLFSSVQGAQTLGQQAMHQYYASRGGQNLADEVYPQG